MIINRSWDVCTFSCGDLNLEVITTRLAILVFIITSLDNKFNRFTNSLVLQDTRAITKRFVGTSVQKVSITNRSGGKFITKQWKLYSALFRSKILETGCQTGQLSFAHKSTGNIDSEFSGSVDKSGTNSEVNFDRLILETLTFNVTKNTTGELTKRGINFSDGIRRSNNLVDWKCVEITEPAVIPAAKNKEAGILNIIWRASVLTSRRHNSFVFRFDLVPGHRANI